MQKTTSIREQKNHASKIQLENPLQSQRKFFEIMYVQNNEDQSVEVYESTVLDFNDIIDNLNIGNSVFITKKQPVSNKVVKKTKPKDEYINHV